MLRYVQLRQNPVSVSVRDKTGATFAVRAERLRRGRVKMSCECPRQLAAGWCQHCLAVFADPEIFESDKQRRAFKHIVNSTYLESAANELTKALDVFAAAYRQMKFDRPAELDPSQLNSFAKRAYQGGETASHLAQALEHFIEELRLQPSLVVASNSSDQTERSNSPWQSTVSESEPTKTTSRSSEENDSALEMVRKALEKNSNWNELGLLSS
jgi:tetratricopeptide (TPR) repeat protein